MTNRIRNRSNLALLLTACIKVGDSSFVARNQTEVRLQDYKQALKLWLTKQHTINKLILCDNSGYSLAELQAVVDQHNPYNKQVELLSYHLTDYHGRGYGWGEIDIYRYAFANSELLGESGHVGFVAGRKFVRNIDQITRALPTQFGMAANWLHNLTWTEADLYFVNTKLFQTQFIPKLLEITDDRTAMYMERAVAHVMHDMINANYTWYPLAYYPRYAGVMGKKDIPLWQRKQNWWLYNLVASKLSRLQYTRERTVTGDTPPHLLLTLKDKRTT